MATKRFRLFYRSTNGGDGSVSTRFHTVEKRAEKAEEKEEESCEHFAEPTIGEIELEVIDGQIYLVGERYDHKNDKMVEFRNPLVSK